VHYRQALRLSYASRNANVPKHVPKSRWPRDKQSNVFNVTFSTCGTNPAIGEEATCDLGLDGLVVEQQYSRITLIYLLGAMLGIFMYQDLPGMPNSAKYALYYTIYCL
jgi:hypothetical protein